MVWVLEKNYRLSSRNTTRITLYDAMHSALSSKFALDFRPSLLMIRTSTCSLLIGALVVVNPVQAEECDLKGFDVVSVAESSGFSISVKKVGGSGSCTVVNRNVLIAAGQEGEGVMCDVTFFDGGKLHSDWKISKMNFAGPQYTVKTHAKWPARDPKIVVRVSLDAGKTDTLRVKKFHLIGPDCADWKDAFVSGE